MSEKDKNMVYDTACVAFIALEKKKTKVTDQKYVFKQISESIHYNLVPKILGAGHVQLLTHSEDFLKFTFFKPSYNERTLHY